MSDRASTLLELLMPARKGSRRYVVVPAEWMKKIRRGLPQSSVRRVARAMNVTEPRLRSILRLATASNRRRGLGHGESDRLFRLARIFARAEDVFGSRAKASAWLQKPNRALDGTIPLEIVDTAIGEEQVMDELERIEHGVFG